MKPSWVLDASIASAWILPDEQSAKALGFRDNLPTDTAFWVPALWWYEVANSLEAARRRGRLTEADQTRAAEGLALLRTETDSLPGIADLSRLVALARGRGISAYDAAYLDLAERLGLGLATLDARLAAAARKAGVPTAP